MFPKPVDLWFGEYTKTVIMNDDHDIRALSLDIYNQDNFDSTTIIDTQGKKLGRKYQRLDSPNPVLL